LPFAPGLRRNCTLRATITTRSRAWPSSVRQVRWSRQPSTATSRPRRRYSAHASASRRQTSTVKKSAPLDGEAERGDRAVLGRAERFGIGGEPADLLRVVHRLSRSLGRGAPAGGAGARPAPDREGRTLLRSLGRGPAPTWAGLAWPRPRDVGRLLSSSAGRRVARGGATRSPWRRNGVAPRSGNRGGGVARPRPRTT
jgi:hypothetical protein